MKLTLMFDGNNERKKLAGFHVVDDKGAKVAKPTLWPIWVTKTDFVDGLPDGFEIEMKPIYKNKKPVKAAAKDDKKPTNPKPNKKEKANGEKPAEQTA